jgi:hypothetical protein
MRDDKALAIHWRKQGKTYNEISKRFAIPKSTLSRWFKNLKLPARIKDRLWTNAQRKWAESITDYNKKRALDILSKANETQLKISKEIGKLTRRELMLVGTALYWAEGSKKERWSAKFCNSDPRIISLMMRFFREICSVCEEKFRAYLQVHSNISETKAKIFWSKISGIPLRQFIKTQTMISRSSKFRRLPNTLPDGTFSVRISDVNLVNRIKGWMLGLTKV